jgi:hypothetical protein
MPSAEHESPIALAKVDPDIMACLLADVFDLEVPRYEFARPHATDVRSMTPRTYHADSMTVLCGPAGRAVPGCLLEVQRDEVAEKVERWKEYGVALEGELKVPVALVVFCPDPAVARYYRRRVGADRLSCVPLRPLIFTPDDLPLVVDPDLAKVNPALVVLAAACHGDDAEVDAAFPALAEAMRCVDPHKAISYYDIVLARLAVPARIRWEKYMTTAVDQYQSELFRTLAAEHEALGLARGEAKGKAEGEAKAVLTVLDTRGVPVPDAIRERILACADLAQLETWLRRAVTATTAADVVGG